MNDEDFVSYKVARKLKKCGFKYKCVMAYYDNMYSHHSLVETNRARAEKELVDYTEIFDAPTLAAAAKWLREEKKLAINVIAHDGGYYLWDVTFLPNAPEYKTPIHLDYKQYDSYESALAAGLEETLKMIESGEE